MSENKEIKINVTTVCLIIALIIIGIMVYFTCKFYIEKERAIEEINILQKKLELLDKTKNQDEENHGISLFDNKGTLNYTSDWKDSENGKIAVLKIGEESIKEECKNNCFIEIKEVKDVYSEFFMMGNDNWAALYKCTLKYIDNKKEEGQVDVAVIVPTDGHNEYIMADFNRYTGSTSFVRGFTELYDNNVIE